MGFVGKQGVEPWVVPFVRATKKRQTLLGREHLVDCEEGGDDGGKCCVGCLCCLSECVYPRTYACAMNMRVSVRYGGMGIRTSFQSRGLNI